MNYNSDEEIKGTARRLMVTLGWSETLAVTAATIAEYEVRRRNGGGSVYIPVAKTDDTMILAEHKTGKFSVKQLAARHDRSEKTIRRKVSPAKTDKA